MSNYFDNKEVFLEPKVNQYGGHMVMTGVQKPSKRKYVNIDTRFCDEYFNSYGTASYMFTLPQRIAEVKSVMVCNLELPLFVCNISSTIGNNSFLVDNSMIILPDGFYSDPNFVNMNNPSYMPLQSTINASLSAMGITGLTYDICYNYSVFTNTTTDTTYELEFDVTNGRLDKNLYKSRLGWTLGYHNGCGTSASKYVVLPNTTILVSDAAVNLNGPRYLYLVLDEVSNGNQNSFYAPISNYTINKNIIARISLNPAIYPYGSILPANNFNGYLLSDRRSYNGKVDLQKLMVQLIDEFGNPVSLNGNDFSFCMEVEYE